MIDGQNERHSFFVYVDISKISAKIRKNINAFTENI